jgi:hypothetical protein
MNVATRTEFDRETGVSGVAQGPVVSETPAADETAMLEKEISRVHSLLEGGDVEGARALLGDLRARWPNSERVQRFARVIAPPETSVQPGKRSRAFIRERAWVREHASEHPGRWLAVYEDRLIAEDTDLQRLLSKVRETIGKERALIHKQAASANPE